jgi:flagellar hook-basal body complex protein FliE
MDLSKIPAGMIAPRPLGPLPGVNEGKGLEQLSGSGGLRPSFSDTLKGALDEVKAKSAVSDQAITNVMTGQGSVHEAMIAMQDSAVAMDMVLAVRNKVLEAYQEVIRMPV